MSSSVFKRLLLTAASLLPFAQAHAHTNSVGYENAGPGAITFWYGTWHNHTAFTEGSFRLLGQNVTYDITVPFTNLVSTKPAGLIDGTTNFYSNGTALVGVNAGQPVYVWQGVSFTGLQAGTYTFTYVPIAQPTQTWQPMDNVILSSQVTLTAADLGVPMPEPEPEIIDSSQGSFSEDDAAAGGSELTFDGGTLAPNKPIDINKPVTLLTHGGVIDTGKGNLTLSNTIGGAGGLTKTGQGVLTLSGPNTYTGGTIINGGTLLINAPGALSSGVLTGSGGTLAVGYDGALPQNITLQGGGLIIDTQGHTVVSSGEVSGDGGFTKTGEGVLNFTGTANGAGPVIIGQGHMAVNGKINLAPVTVSPGASIGGNGTLGGLIVRNRATAAPGNSIGKLSVGTFVIFEKGSAYAVEVDAAGNNDRIDVTGTATLEGGTVQVLAEHGDYRPLSTYTILTAGAGVTGQFEAVTSNLAFLSPELAYSANAVTLTLVRNDVAFASVATTRNQAGVGQAADQAFRYGSPVYAGLVRGTADAARQAFDQMSGEAYAGTLSAAVAESEAVRGGVLDRLRAPADQGVTAWGAIYGARGKTQADGNAAALNRESQGAILGVEAVTDRGVRFGVAGTFGEGSADVAARRSTSDSETTQIWGYGSAKLGGFALRGGVGYADLNSETERLVFLRDVSERLTGKQDASVTQAFAEVGYAMDVRGVTVEPLAGLSSVQVKTDAFRESGGATALNGAKSKLEAAFTTLGVRGESAFGPDDALKARFGAAWRHSLQDETPTAQLAFQAGGPAFQVLGAAIDRDALALDAGLDWSVNERLSVGGAYQGALGENAEDHLIKASVSLKF